MTSKRIKRVLLITYDLNLNQTSSKRYFSFIKALSDSQDFEILALGIRFPFRSHPINPDNKANLPKDIEQYVRTISPNHLNLIQRLLVFLDKKNAPYFLKKILLAAHILCYKVDQWYVDLRDLDGLNFVPDVVISGGSGGIIKTSYNLAGMHGASLILDYRDPWNFGYNLLETGKIIYYYKKIFSRKAELKFLNHANKIITVSRSLKSFFPERIQEKVLIIENGSNFEEFDFDQERTVKKSTFVITYLGTIYNDQLLDLGFFEAISRFIVGRNLRKEDIKVLFLGGIKNVMLPKIVAKYQLMQYVEITDRKDYNQLLPYLKETCIFLHLKYGNRSQIISSKQADYIMLRKPILLPNTDHGDIAESITSNNAGYVCDGSIDSIINALQIEYDKFLKGESNTLENRDFTHLSRSKIAEKLLDII